MQASRLSMLLVRGTISRIQKRRTIARYDTKRRDNETRCNPFVTLYIATSQDGFIADEHGSVDWLPGPESNADSTCATDYGYAKFFESIDTVVMGSKSYEQVLTFGVEWPYSGKQCFVFTGKPLEHSCRNDNNNGQISFASPDISSFMHRMGDERPQSKIWLVGGAQLIKSFQQQALIDKCIITVIPKRIQHGISLPIDLVRDFTLMETKEFPGDVIQNTYEARMT